MVAEAEVMLKQNLPMVLDVKLSASVSCDLLTSFSGLKLDDLVHVPVIRSGSYADIGPRRFMEDEHICIDDLSSRIGSFCELPNPSAFYAVIFFFGLMLTFVLYGWLEDQLIYMVLCMSVFDGHGGPEAAAYVRKNAIRLFFGDDKFPQTSEVDSIYVEEVKSSLRNAFLQADLDLAEDRSVGSSSGTTALAAFVLGRHLMVANAGDCRAVLCRNGEAIDMSQDHRPVYLPERRRVEECGGFIDDGYLNGVLSVTRALGDWDMKLPRGSKSPLIAEPEFRQICLTEDDEFMIMGCDGIWDVLTSQEAVSLVRSGLRRHDDPMRCARELAMEALRLNTFDNLTVVVVCFVAVDDAAKAAATAEKQRCCSLTAEAFDSLRSLLEG